MNNLTIKDKNCLIAQFLGWAECDWAPVESIPNYFEDLNAMHEAEKVFTEGQMGAYAYVLLETTGFREKSGVWTFHATAAQRAEAFGKTLNLW